MICEGPWVDRCTFHGFGPVIMSSLPPEEHLLSSRAALLNEGIGHQLPPVQKRMRAVRWLEAPLHWLDMLANAERPPHSMIRQLVQPHVLFHLKLEGEEFVSLHPPYILRANTHTKTHPRKDKAFPSWNLGMFYYVWVDYLLNPMGNKKQMLWKLRTHQQFMYILYHLSKNPNMMT